MTNLIFIHGISAQTTGYSNKFFKNIVRAYVASLIKSGVPQKDAQDKASEFVQKELLWADITTDLTNRYLSLQYDFKKRLGKWNFVIKPVDPLVVQIMYYVKDKGHKKGPMSILKDIDYDFKRACSNKPDKVVILAHSLGSVIAYDYVFGFRRYKLNPKICVEALITLGSPIPLFTSAMGYVDNKIKLPDNVKRWINILDPDDGVARYCKPYFKNIGIEDKEVNTSWEPLGAHAGYWKAQGVADVIAEKFQEWKI